MSAASGSGIPQRDEDSGLHDIKNLASSQRMRLSRRSTQNPIIPDDDVLASSSAGWKAVALPEPARMVSLPELAELPSKAEIKAREKAQKAAEKAAARDSKKDLAAVAPVAAPAVEAPVAAPVATAVAPAEPIAAPVAKAAAVTPIGSRVAAKKSGSTKILAIAGIGLAAAAGVTIFVMTNKNGDKAGKQDASRAESAGDRTASAPAAKEESRKASEKPAPAQIATDEKKDAKEEKEDKEDTAAGSGAVAPSDMGSAAAQPTPKVEPKADKQIVPPPTKKAPEAKPKKEKEPETTKAPEKPTGPATIKAPDDGKKTVGKGKPGEPDFDQLLKEAGVKEKPDAPKIEKKQLTMGEFKAAMAGITGVAQKCYAGTSGTALVRVSIAPSGKVSGVQVTGAFAGTPVGACVENAVRGLSFPPWDGPPQSFGYSYLLAE